MLRDTDEITAAVYLQNRPPESASMRYLIFTLIIGFLILVFGFRKKGTVKIASEIVVATTDSINKETTDQKSFISKTTGVEQISPRAVEFVEYAKSLTGTPYLYGSVDPAKGLDCSGFINAVSNHFGIKVPRSSVEFTNLGTTVESKTAKPGDLILFTGTDPRRRIVGHIGIVTENIGGQLQFIHSSSGKANGVTTSELEGYYETRFVKVIRILPATEKHAA